MLGKRGKSLGKEADKKIECLWMNYNPQLTLF